MLRLRGPETGRSGSEPGTEASARVYGTGDRLLLIKRTTKHGGRHFPRRISALLRNPFFSHSAHQFHGRRMSSQRQRGDLPLQSDLQHFVHGGDELEIHFLSDVLRNIGEILLIVLWKYEFKNSLPVRGKHFFL